MAKAKRIYKGEKLPKGVTKVVRNRATYFYVRVDGERKYCGKDDRGFELARAARQKYEYRKIIDRMYTTGQEDEAKRLESRLAEFKTVTAMVNYLMEKEEGRIEEKQIGRGKSKKKITYSTFKRNSQQAEHIIRLLGNKRPGQVDLPDLEVYREKRVTEGAAPATINGEIGLLRKAYNRAKIDKKIRPDHIPTEFPSEEIEAESPPITKKQYEKLLKIADSDFRDFIVAGWETGMRSGEICELKKRQVVFDAIRILTGGQRVTGNYLKLGYTTKTGKPREVVVTEVLKEVLKRRLKELGPDDYVFSQANGNPYYGELVKQRMKRCCDSSNVPYGIKTRNEDGERIGITFHSFKTSFVTRKYDEGWPEHLISQQVGTSVNRILRKHYDKGDVGRIMLFVNGIAEGRNKTEQNLAESPQNSLS